MHWANLSLICHPDLCWCLWLSLWINDKWYQKKKDCFVISISLNSCCKPQKFVPRWASAFANWLPRGSPDLPSLLHKLTTAAALIKSWMEVPECSFPLIKVRLQSGIGIIWRGRRQGASVVEECWSFLFGFWSRGSCDQVSANASDIHRLLRRNTNTYTDS